MLGLIEPHILYLSQTRSLLILEIEINRRFRRASSSGRSCRRSTGSCGRWH